MAKVSVIIPAYNRAHCIERAIKSVRDQTFTDMEIIVVDDASTDNTGEVVTSISDERIRYIRCETNRGPTVRNEGMKAAQGKYIAFLDSDDEWLPDKIEKQVALMDSLSEDWGVCHTGLRIIKDGTAVSVFRPKPLKDGEVLRDFMGGKIYFQTSTIMVRRAVVEKIGFFDERLRYGEDAEFLYRAFRHFRLAVIPEVTAVFHVDTTKGCSPVSAVRFESSRLTFLEKHEKAIRSELGFYAARRFRGNNFWLIADAKFNAGEFASGVRYFLRAVAVFPLMSPRRYARMLATTLGLTKLVKRVRVRGGAV